MLNLGGSLFAQARPFTITYQGHATHAGQPISGLADFKFTMFASETGTAVVGGPTFFEGSNAIDVRDGKFLAELNFTSFDGGARYLEIEIRYPSGVGAYQALGSRQPVTAAPYAMAVRKNYVTKIKSISPSAFVPNSSIPFIRNALEIFRTTGTATSLMTQFYADLDLPHGAILDQVVFYVVDGDPTTTNTCYALRNNVDGVANPVFLQQETGVSFASTAPVTLTMNVSTVVDNINYHYAIGCQWQWFSTPTDPSLVKIRRAKITYRVYE